MAETGSYTESLSQALEQRREVLETKALPELKEQYRAFLSSYQGLLNVLLRKGLIQEDPYKYDERISEIEPPPDTPFLDSEKHTQVSIRLSKLESQLDFLNSYGSFDLESMTLKQIKNMVALTRYVKWAQLNETSTHLLTRTLAEYVARLRGDSDPLSIGIVKDAHEQILRASKRIIETLKDTANYQKELFKLTLREEVLRDMDLSPGQATGKRDETIKQMSKRYASVRPRQPFYQELAGEVLDEDYGPNGSDLKQEVLERIRPQHQETEEKKSSKERLQPLLLEAAKTLAAASRPLEDLAGRIEDNVVVYEQKPKGFFDRFKEWVLRVSNQESVSRNYDVEFLDETTSTVHTETINVDQFVQELRKRATLYGALLNRASPTYQKVAKASEDQLFQFLQKHSEELFVMHRRISSIDTFIRTEVSRDKRNQLRAMQVSLSNLKDALLKANKKRHDYLSRKEEAQQLKRLGIDDG
ncbi:MAG: hypothetical protein ACLFPV_03390 [Spirochaetaceae bacterium]